MNDAKNSMDMSEVAANLPAAAGGALGELPPEVAALPPKVQKRVQKLRELQSHHNELEAKFLEERALLETKYQKLYEPLYTKRNEVVNGVVEVDGVVSDAATEQTEEKGSGEKGVPNFWLNALKAHQLLADEITQHDEEALKYLTDIKWCRIDDPKGFKLEFFFNPNPFFKNTILTKTYHMANDDDNEPILEKAIGTDIEWNSGKCLTEKLLKKKPRKGAKNAQPIIKTEKCESFFNFFNPPEVPDDDDDLDEDDAEELEGQMEQDYEIGTIIRDKIIPHAVSWFTGEAKDDDYEDDEDTNEIDEDDEEEDEDDEDDDDNEGLTNKKGMKPQHANREQPPECKQQ